MGVVRLGGGGGRWEHFYDRHDNDAHTNHFTLHSVHRSDEGAKCGKRCADEYSTTALFILFGCLRLCQITVSVVTLYTNKIFLYIF